MSNRKWYPKNAITDKYAFINSWEMYKEHFHDMNVNKNSGIKNYKQAKNHYQSLAQTQPYCEILDELNFEKQEKNNISLSLDSVITQTINQIQQEGNLWKFIEKGQGNIPMTLNLSQGQQIINSWQNIINLAAKEEWQSVGAHISRLKSLIEALQIELKSGVEIIDMNKILGKAADTKATSLALSIQGTLNGLRGAVLEEMTVQFLKENLPDKISYQTGNITVNGTQIKEDIITLFDNLEIINKEGKVIYKFQNGDIVDAEGVKTKNVAFTEEEYQQLLNAPGLGFTAKTSQSNTIFHGGYNINTLLADAGYKEDQIVCQLYHMYQLGIGDNIDLYQKYAVSKIVTKILGEKNAFMVSRNKIIPTYQYVEKLLYNPLKFSNTKVGTRSMGDKLNTNFGTTDIVGPSPSKV